MAARANTYNFTVQGENSLLEVASRQRKKAACGEKQSDHIVELQLVVAALNTLPKTTYTREGWQRELVDFFNGRDNLQCLAGDKNLEKGQAVGKFIRGESVTKNEMNWIRQIKQSWDAMKEELNNFDEFKAALDGKLASVRV